MTIVTEAGIGEEEARGVLGKVNVFHFPLSSAMLVTRSPALPCPNPDISDAPRGSASPGQTDRSPCPPRLTEGRGHGSTSARRPYKSPWAPQHRGKFNLYPWAAAPRAPGPFSRADLRGRGCVRLSPPSTPPTKIPGDTGSAGFAGPALGASAIWEILRLFLRKAFFSPAH